MTKKMPDPSYWGNPPQTPTRGTSTRQAHSMPQNPYQQNSQQPQPQAQPQQGFQYQQPGFQSQQTQPTPQPDFQSQQQPTSQAQPGFQPQQQQTSQAQPGFQYQQPGFQSPQPQPIPQPIPQPQQPGASQQSAPVPPKQKSHHGCLIGAIIAIVLVIVLGIAGCVALTGYAASTLSDPNTNYRYFSIPEQPSTPDLPDDANTVLNNEYFRHAFDLTGNASLSNEELATIKETYYPNQSGQPNEENQYTDGVYYIGTDIPAGSYWFSGSDTDISYFFILSPNENNDLYDVTHMNNYYGHNIMEVKDGQVLVVANNGTMQPLSSFNETFSSPYGSGTYRVGTDIPAGTYQLALGDANDYSACYVMRDLEYSEDSYLYESYYISGDKPGEITLEEGTYVELYNMSMTSLTT